MVRQRGFYTEEVDEGEGLGCRKGGRTRALAKMRGEGGAVGAGRPGTGVRNQTPSESDGFITNNRWVGVQQAASPCRYGGADWARLHTEGGQVGWGRVERMGGG